MTAARPLTPTSNDAGTWAEANQGHLRAELHRLRLLLQRKVRWLRHTWHHDPLGAGQGMVISEALADRLLAGDEIEAERRFHEEDATSAAITRSVDELEAELGQSAEGAGKPGGVSALDVLARLFGLGPLDRHVLLLCLAPEEDPAFATLYAYAQDDAHARYPTLHLALSLLGPGPAEQHDGARVLLPTGPLRRFRMVNVLEGTGVLRSRCSRCASTTAWPTICAASIV